MRSIWGVLAALFFLGSLISGLLAALNGSSSWARSFWIALIFFFASSSVFLFSLVPFWIALAPALPALILVMIFCSAKYSGSDSDDDAHE